MGGKTQLYKRSSLVFFFLGVVALGLQLAALLLPFWHEDDWRASAILSQNGRHLAPFRVFQGPWSDYTCWEGFEENNGSSASQLSYRECSIRLRGLKLGSMEVSMPKFLALRVLETTSLGLGFISVLSIICLYVTSRDNNCKRLTSQIIFSFSSLAAGLCAVMGVMILAGTVASGKLAWALSFPVVAGFLWLANGAFFFVICRYNPSHDTPQSPVGGSFRCIR
ncbi:uncharacterized protein [Littorina saxatilis]|uniref:Uncharacterized protein n=1 Tax=Littorina saxatilis TaxID=31220 RepID=A0AAN9ANR9_9CAEN